MDAFASLMSEVRPASGHFGHREHLHLAWLAVRRHGSSAAEIIADGIQRTTRDAGVPQKYNATVTVAWLKLVAHHVPGGPEDFAGFLAVNSRLLDKRLLARHYSSTRLASSEARQAWTEPDLLPLPTTPGKAGPPAGQEAER